MSKFGFKISSGLSIPLQKFEEGVTYLSTKIDYEELGYDRDERFSDTIFIGVKTDVSHEDIIAEISVKTTITLVCDRCNVEFKNKIEEKTSFLCSLDKGNAVKDDDEVRIISESASEINIERDVYDMLLLSIPQKVLCRKECRGLCGKCGENLNENQCSCNKNQKDLRWEKLKDIDFDN